MKNLVALGLVAGIPLWLAPQTANPPDEAELRAAVAAFSATTALDGAGWEAYADFLHPAFTRWYMDGESGVLGKEAIAANLASWWKSGARVGDSQVEFLSVAVHGELGLVRRNVDELYVDGDGAADGSSRNHVTQVWILEEDAWRLLAMDIAPRKEE